MEILIKPQRRGGGGGNPTSPLPALPRWVGGMGIRVVAQGLFSAPAGGGTSSGRPCPRVRVPKESSERAMEIAVAWNPPGCGPNLTSTSEVTNPPGLSPGHGPLCPSGSCGLGVICSKPCAVWRVEGQGRAWQADSCPRGLEQLELPPGITRGLHQCPVFRRPVFPCSQPPGSQR